ncbi:MAG TPA: ATPase, T2SS/T4P/T4SS family, partial [candidate division Zixibacteria bacterium]|nr:ATPase, T2SS/T4P/T4SS family [candidate division Zixibacteria bacterium]
TFATCLRSILRQNPDVIMVGEIRDVETARMAVRSALTGHLVFSTIHTNDTASSVTRLVDIGVERYLVASALKGALAQRLVRLNCPECLEEYDPPASLVKLAGLDGAPVFRRSVGCPRCRNSGHSGMVGLFEYLTVDDTVREMIVRGDSDVALKRYARETGMRTLFEHGASLLREGRITLEELLQVALPEKSRSSERVNVGV